TNILFIMSATPTDPNMIWYLSFRVSNGSTPIIAGTTANDELFTITYTMQIPTGITYKYSDGDTEPINFADFVQAVEVISNDKTYYEMLNTEDLDFISDPLSPLTATVTDPLYPATATSYIVEWQGVLTIPHCIYAYSFYKVSSVNLVNGDLSAFSL